MIQGVLKYKKNKFLELVLELHAYTCQFDLNEFDLDMHGIVIV